MEVRTISPPTREDGYMVHHEMWNAGTVPEEDTEMHQAYTYGGLYIGTPDDAEFLCAKLGIAPELKGPDSQVCSIGFSFKNQKWYGWSHRGHAGFTIGSTVGEDDIMSMSGWTDEYLTEHPEADRSLPAGFKAETLADARRMAVAFAEAVG